MVLYLGLNYVEQAVTAKRTLLGKCLIVVPQHLDNVEAYLHKGKLPDEKYRFPWKRAKRDDEFLIEESANIITDAQCLATENAKTFGIESFNSQKRSINTSVTETVNFYLDCDVVPSSNPSTQDLFSPDDFFTEQNLFQETFEKENLKCFSSTHDSLKIESTENTDETLGDSLLTVPDLSRLASKLKAVHVKDPFVQEADNPVLEKKFRNEKKYNKDAVEPMLQTNYDADITRETFHRVPVPSELKVELEDVVVLGPDFLGPDSINLMKSELLTSIREHNTVFVMENEPDIITVVSKNVVKPDQIHLQIIENIGHSPAAAVNTTFLDINEIVVTEQDRLCERAVLDSPVVDGCSSDLNYTQQPLPLPGRGKFEMSSSDSNLLDTEKRKSLMQRVWQSQKYCDEIQASRLPEPEFSKNTEEKEHTIKQTKRLLNVLTDTTTGTSDLELNWEIIKYTEEITDPCKCVVPFIGDSRNCEEKKEDVEKIEKYEPGEMYDWQDENISLEVCKSKNIVSVEQGRCFIESKKKPNFALQESLGKETFSDPLGDFMALRSKKTTVTTMNPKVENLVCESKLLGAEEVLPLDRKQAREEIAKLKQNFESKKRVKHHVVEIKISEEYRRIIAILETASENCLNVLKQAGEISQSFTFKTASPDISRFLLKQKEKYLADHGDDGSSDELYKMVVILHGLVVASEITINCCLESAIGYLGALQEKYKEVLGASLDSVRHTLFEIKAQFFEEKVHHPKVVTLCREIETWLKKKRAKTKDTEQKILILVKREMPSLLNCLKNALKIGNLISPCIVSCSESEDIINSLDKHNCAIALTKMISEHFPWAQFSLVVEYENEASSPWQHLCERQHIRHIGLGIQSHEKRDTSCWSYEYPEEQICLIGSQKVIKNTELLQILETRHNILLIERDYSLIGDAKHLFFSDIDVDASSAIVLEDVKDMNDDCVVQNLVTKMVALSLKYVNCWFVLFSDAKNGSYQYPGHVISNIGRLQAAVANFVERSNYFKAKVLFCEGCNEASSLIRAISENCLAQHEPVHSWKDRSWLTDEMTQKERFLVMLPCLSSFSSQLLLQRVPIKRIFMSSSDALSKEVPDIAAPILQNLEKLMTSSIGLQLRGELSRDKSGDDCYDVVVTGANIVHDNKVSEKDVVEFPVQPQVERKDTISRDIYIPEDFQKFGEYVPIDTDMHEQISKENESTSEKTDHKYEPKVLTLKKKMYKDCFNEIPGNQSVPMEGHSKEVIMSSNAFTYKNGKEENISNKSVPRRDNDFGEWEHLNNFISSKYDSERDQTRKDCVEKGEGNTQELKCSLHDARDMNPVEKLKIMRQRSLINCSIPERSNSGKRCNSFGKNEHDDESRYFPEHNKNDYVNTAQNYVNDNKKSADQLPSVADNTKMLPKRPEMRRPNINRETYEMNQDYESQHHAYSGDNMNRHHKSLCHTDKPKERFDYNHGLPFNKDQSVITDKGVLENPSKSDVSLRTNYKNNINQVNRNAMHNQYGFSTGCRVPKSRNDLEREFPPSDEIDRSVSIENVPNYFADNLILGRSNTNSRTCNVSTNEHCQPRGSIHVNDDFECVIQRGDNKFPALTGNGYEQNDSEYLQKENPVLTSVESQSMQFDFRPKMIECRSNIDKTVLEAINGNDGHGLFFNPELERITQKQHTLEEPAELSDTGHTISLADDLRETTRKLLANSRQFSRFDTHSKRHPLQKVSIGLAQPRLRNNTNITEDLQLPEDDRMMMAESLWATDDSPPMDLEYDNSEINRILQNREDTSNRAIYTNQTPRKKRKLTYQSVPGKGQTKLVFK